ncbi:hypothetical protein HUJ04_011643 [Dendroctonus ponderosae]|nr:hypothetical protein HUJ04_011643 [Dendroctonus ponderosae]
MISSELVKTRKTSRPSSKLSCNLACEISYWRDNIQPNLTDSRRRTRSRIGRIPKSAQDGLHICRRVVELRYSMRNGMVYKLQQIIPCKMITNLISNLLSDRRIKVRLNDKPSSFLHTLNGLPQRKRSEDISRTLRAPKLEGPTRNKEDEDFKNSTCPNPND